jgi:FkbM family methyltransferase
VPAPADFQPRSRCIISRMKLPSRLRELLVVSGLYRQLLRLSSLTRSNEVAQARARMAETLSTLIPPGSLVFDIGANVGSFSEIYCRMGCRVVAVEPNGDCIRRIGLVYPDLPILTVQVAIGSRIGLATLHISDSWDATSTVSPEWIETMERWDERYRRNWNRNATVPVLTLDSLISHFGEPYYVKIDVEGYELEVLRGLSNQPPLLSFEFHNAFLQAAFDCLDLPLFSPCSVYNLIVNPNWGYHERFERPNWTSKSELRELLQTYTAGDVQGDIFIRLLR